MENIIELFPLADEDESNYDIEIDEIEIPGRRLRKLRPEIVQVLADSMKLIGLRQPIVVTDYPENDTKACRLIAGWHRIEAAKQLGWKAIRASILPDRYREQAGIVEIDENLARGELSPAERAANEQERQRLYLKLHPETKQGGAPGAGRGKRSQTRQNGDLVTPRYTAKAAQETRRPERTIQRNIERANKIDNILALTDTSLDKPGELDALAKLPVPQQKVVIARAVKGEPVKASTELKKVKRSTREEDLAERTIEASRTIGKKLYGVIYADPPWRFEPWSRETGMDRAADNHYPTMGVDAIKGMQIPAADDCVLFLWATAPMLVEALDVMTAWGFTYKSHCVWIKDKFGTGYWFRAAHELLLVGTKGNIPAPAPGTQSSSVIQMPVGVHSAKPAAIADMIAMLFPNLPRLELFARDAALGWDTWGNEV